MLHRTLIRNFLDYRRDLFLLKKCLSSEVSQNTSQNEEKGGFARAYEKYTSSQIHENTEEKNDIEFSKLLRNSKLVDLGDAENKVVYGKIFHIVKDDLYIDIGLKFHCVCTRPKKNSEAYVRGAKVRVLLKDTELSSKFLGSNKDLTILEADGILLGIVKKNISSEAVENTST